MLVVNMSRYLSNSGRYSLNREAYDVIMGLLCAYSSASYEKLRDRTQIGAREFRNRIARQIRGYKNDTIRGLCSLLEVM